MSEDQGIAKSRIRSQLWDFVKRNGWRDQDDFTLRFAEKLFQADRNPSIENPEVAAFLSGIRTNFFTANKLSKQEFLRKLRKELWPQLKVSFGEATRAFSVGMIFPEISRIRESDARDRLGKLDVPERFIQDTLRRVLRAKKASPVPDRRRDTAQEVADIEYFRLPIGGAEVSVAVVVKGFRSVSGRTVTWENIAHQVMKAYRGKPDHILLVSAKDPSDGVLTHLQEYAESVGNPELILFLPPLDLARLFIAHRAL
jgi:hypothetical protein